MRVAGVQIPDSKRVEAALTYIYGIGWSNVSRVLGRAKVDPDKRAKDLSEKEVRRLQEVIDQIPTEGELRQRVREDIQRLITIGSYRGLRHQLNLPVRGQRTRTNARTKRGKRKTIGALKKEARARLGKLGAAGELRSQSGKK
jgi:small subunit ribosomal protein S13